MRYHTVYIRACIIRWMSRQTWIMVEYDSDIIFCHTEALARAEGQSLNETVKLALREAVERRQKDPAFRRRVRQIIDDDRELLERLAK